eukprot:8558107-Alexandrium_andersonii.AAC.1
MLVHHHLDSHAGRHLICRGDQPHLALQRLAAGEANLQPALLAPCDGLSAEQPQADTADGATARLVGWPLRATGNLDTRPGSRDGGADGAGGLPGPVALAPSRAERSQRLDS